MNPQGSFHIFRKKIVFNCFKVLFEFVQISGRKGTSKRALLLRNRELESQTLPKQWGESNFIMIYVGCLCKWLLTSEQQEI